MDPDWTFIDFLNAASQRLELVPSAKRVFNANGEISVQIYTLISLPSIINVLMYYNFEIASSDIYYFPLSIHNLWLITE